MPNTPDACPTRDAIYVAGPLFSDSEKEFNRRVKDVLGRAFDVYLPQEDGKLLAELVDQGASPHVAGKSIFQIDLAAIRRSSCLLIVLDGRAVDEGAAFELGVAYALGKKCYGLQTDVRRLLSYGNNPMIDHAMLQVFRSVEELAAWAESYASRALQRGLPE